MNYDQIRFFVAVDELLDAIAMKRDAPQEAFDRARLVSFDVLNSKRCPSCLREVGTCGCASAPTERQKRWMGASEWDRLSTERKADAVRWLGNHGFQWSEVIQIVEIAPGVVRVWFHDRLDRRTVHTRDVECGTDLPPFYPDVTP